MSDDSSINLGSLFSAPTLSGPGSTDQEVPTTSSFFSTDSLSASASKTSSGSGIVATIPVLEPGRISISDFSNAVVSSLNTFKKTANATDQTNDLVATQQWYTAASTAALMIKVQAEVKQLVGTETTLEAQQEQQLLDYTNNGLATYNGVLNSATTSTSAMYNNQQAYISNSETTATYNAQVATWNTNLPALNASIQSGYTAYVTATNAINAKIAANNAAIDQINAQRAAVQITAQIPHQPLVTLVTPAPALLPTIASAPPTPAAPTVPVGFPDIPAPAISVVSTSVSVTPTNPTEAAFLATVQGDFNSINSGTLNSLDSELAKASTTVSTMQQSSQPFSTYLAYATSENATLTTLGNAYIADVTNFNTNILPGINTQINALNVSRASAGEALIPLQQAIPVPTLSSILLPTTPPVPATANFYPTITLIVPNAPTGSITPTSSASYLAGFYNNIFATELASITNYTKNITNAQAFVQYKVFNLRGLSNVKNGYIAQSKIAQNSTIAFTGPGVGAALTSNIAGLDSPAITSILSGSLLKVAQINTKESSLPQHLFNQLAISGIQALLSTSLYSGLFGASLLDNAAPNGTAAKAAFALAFLNTASGVVSSGGPANSVKSILATSGVSEDAKAKLAGPLTAALQLGLLQVGVFNVANALGLPGLAAQVIGNSNAGSAINQSLAASSGNGLNDVLNNSVSVVTLKQKLVDYVVGKGIWPASTAQTLINSAINKSLGKNDFTNNTEWATNLVRGFKAIGLDDATTAKLTDESLDFARSEQVNQDLDTAYVQQNVNDQATQNDLYQRQDVQAALNTISANQEAQTQTDYSLRDFRADLITQLQVQGNNLKSSRVTADAVLASIRSDQLKDNFNSQNVNSSQLNNSLVNGLVANGSSTAAAQSTADDVTADTIKKRLTSEFDARESIQNSLVASGIEATTAANISTNAALLLDNVNPLRDTRSSQILDQQSLAEALNTEIKNKLRKTVGINDATKIANQTVLTLLGTANSATTVAGALAAPNVGSENEIVTDQVTRPTSVLNQINSAIGEVKNAYEKKADEALTKTFRAFRSPNIDLFALMDRIRDPGQSLQFIGLMYSDKGNVKIDVRV